MPDNVRQLPSAVVSPQLAALRAELAVLHDIFAIIRSGRMPPEEWPKAKAVMEYIDGKISAVQAKADALTEAEGDDGNQTPDPDSVVIPDLAKAEAAH